MHCFQYEPTASCGIRKAPKRYSASPTCSFLLSAVFSFANFDNQHDITTFSSYDYEPRVLVGVAKVPFLVTSVMSHEGVVGATPKSIRGIKRRNTKIARFFLEGRGCGCKRWHCDIPEKARCEAKPKVNIIHPRSTTCIDHWCHQDLRFATA